MHGDYNTKLSLVLYLHNSWLFIFQHFYQWSLSFYDDDDADDDDDDDDDKLPLWYGWSTKGV